MPMTDSSTCRAPGVPRQAQLVALRAQIEPHFLFNTLATLRRLRQVAPTQGEHLLSHFVAYLRSVQPDQHGTGNTLGQEIELTRAYLGVVSIRMAGRLQVHFDVPQELFALPFPPLMIATLAENAVKHGIAPLPEGGTISVSARRNGESLEVVVDDTGAGFTSSSGTGIGLANIRARLQALYGRDAALSLQAKTPSGVRALLHLPCHDGARLQGEMLTSADQCALLQGHLDPAFLLRVLLRVERDYANQSAGVDRLLEELVGFLRAAMPGLRTGTSTLPNELDLARHYAMVWAQLDPARVSWRIEVTGVMPVLRFPALLLLPLLDALAADGPGPRGTVRVQCTNRRCRLTLEHGGALQGPWLSSTLLYCLKASLQALFGDAWALAVGEETDPALTLELPLE